MWLLLILIVVWACHIFFTYFPVNWHFDCFCSFFHPLTLWQWTVSLSFKSFYVFLYFWLCWVLVASRRLSPAVARGALSLAARRPQCGGFSRGSAWALGTQASVVVAQPMKAFLHQGSSPCHVACVGRWVPSHWRHWRPGAVSRRCTSACLSLGVFLQDSDTRGVVWGLGNYGLQIGCSWQNVNQLSLLLYLTFLMLVRLSQWRRKCSFSLRGLVGSFGWPCSRVYSPGVGLPGWRDVAVELQWRLLH